MPGSSKETRFYFETPIEVRTHASFTEACAQGACAYRSVRQLRFWTRAPARWVYKRFGRLRRHLSTEGAHLDSFSHRRT